jgi:restriction system protein
MTVLLTGLTRRATLNFDSMRRKFTAEDFSPGTRGTAEQPPQWEHFAAPESGMLSRLFGGDARRSHAEQEARLRFENELSAHRWREENRNAELEHAWQQHVRRQAERQHHVDKHNAQGLRSALALEASALPEGVPSEAEVGYRPESGQVLVLRELPDTDHRSDRGRVPVHQESRHHRVLTAKACGRAATLR